jgi:phosphoglycerate dehydrogenase-like enzyme
MGRKIKAGINTTKSNWNYVFSNETKSGLSGYLEFDKNLLSTDPSPNTVAKSCSEAEIIISTWGAVPYTEKILEACPDLNLILYAAGTFKPYVTPELQQCTVTVCTAAHLNAIPTAEFTLGIILSSLKNVYSYHADFLQSGAKAWERDKEHFNGGYYRTRIGLLGFGMITRHLLRLLTSFEMDVYVESSHVSEGELTKYNARRQSLEWIMSNCDVVSIHKSDIPKNLDLINRDNLKLMKKGARLINTARGRLINESDLVEKLKEGEITAYLDVTYPEPPEEGHPFYSLPNCILTPHIAGSIGAEVTRMGDYCLRELRNWIQGKPLENPIDINSLEERA